MTPDQRIQEREREIGSNDRFMRRSAEDRLDEWFAFLNETRSARTGMLGTGLSQLTMLSAASTRQTTLNYMWRVILQLGEVEKDSDHIHLRLLRGKEKQLGFFDTFFGKMATESLREYPGSAPRQNSNGLLVASKRTTPTLQTRRTKTRTNLPILGVIRNLVKTSSNAVSICCTKLVI